MELKSLLLVSAATLLLVAPAFLSPANRRRSENLDHIIDLAQKHKQNLTRRYYVEDVQDLHDSGCKDEFFCKVHQVLHAHEAVDPNNTVGIVMNLEVFINHTRMDCPTLLEGVKSSEVTRPVVDLLDFLTRCIERRNTLGGKSPQAKNKP